MIDQDLKQQPEALPENEQAIWHGIIGTGQSLSCGCQGDLDAATPEAPGGLKLHDTEGLYDILRPNASSLQVVPFTEPIRKQASCATVYPSNIAGKTPQHSMTCAINREHSMSVNKQPSESRYDDLYRTVHTCVGSSGAPMADICKGGATVAYAASIFEVTALARLASEQDAKLSIEAIVLTHGETDAVLNNEGYAQQLCEMQKDYAHDLRVITGQKHDPILILSQQNTSPPTPDFFPTIAQAMWWVQQQSSNAVICSGPKYQYGYAEGGLHLSTGGYDRLGEKYGQVYYQTVVQGRPFIPLSPKRAALATAQGFDIVVSMHVPKPPLTWDEHLPWPHQEGPHAAWKAGRGFEVRDAAGREVAIESVSISGNDVKVRLDSSERPKDFPLRVAYAMSQKAEGFGPGFCGGTVDGRLGHLCDSDLGTGLSTEFRACEVEKGSCVVSCTTKWEGATLYDIVDPGNYVLLGIEGRTVRLDRPWEGETGKNVTLQLRHNQRNYAVSFVMEVE